MHKKKNVNKTTDMQNILFIFKDAFNIDFKLKLVNRFKNIHNVIFIDNFIFIYFYSLLNGDAGKPKFENKFNGI